MCCILSLAFFGILSKPEGAFQHLLLTYFLEVNYFISQRSKLLCLLTYFDRIRQSETDFLAMNVSIRRQAVDKKEPGVFWGKCELPLGSFSCEPNGVIEDSHGDLQVDFANEYIGGGVLQMGNVQVTCDVCEHVLYFWCTQREVVCIHTYMPVSQSAQLTLTILDECLQHCG